MIILFPSSYLESHKVDEDFQKEYESAVNTGLDVILFNQPVWNTNHILLLNTDISGEALYRGWMMKPENYTSFYNQLKKKDVNLITSPEQYERMHCFPNIYEQVKADTPKIMTFPLYSDINIQEIKQNLSNRFFIKDYVKSAKNTDFPTYFDNNTTQEEFNKWIKRFYKIRGGLLTGGIVAKEYVDLKRYNDYTNEYRVFYLNNTPISICRNSLQPIYTPEVSKELIEKYKNLPSLFYTVDFAEKKNGKWTIIETGDGSVSGLSEGQNYEAFYRAIKLIFEKEKEIERD